MPRVHTIAAGAPFLDVLARGLIARAGEDPLALARATVLLPTRRAARALAAALLRESGGDAALAPRALALADLDDDDAWVETDPAARDGVPPAIAPLERLVRLADLVRARPEIGGDPAAAARLAASLAALLDSAALEDASLAKLDAVVPGELAAHWQRSLEALEAARARWPAELARLGRVDPAERQVRLLRARAARWRASPPPGLVVAAGSTGSVPATAELLAVVAGLPDGHVVLPGLDRGLDAASWDAAAEDPCHPQHALARLLATLGVERTAVGDWVSGVDPSPRAALLAEALRPAATTSRWRDAPAPDDSAFAGLGRVAAADPEEEAGAIALAMRSALEAPERTAALVTPDRALARRVAAALGRWGVEVDDSAGVALPRAPHGAFLMLAAEAAAEGAPVPLLALLKHGLARAGRPRAELARLVRRLDRRILRRPAPPRGLTALARVEDPPLGGMLRALAAAAAPFSDLLTAAAAPPRALLQAHVAFAEWMATGPDAPEASTLWSGDAGEAAARFVRELDGALETMAPIRGAAWPALLAEFAGAVVVRPRASRHPRLAIWGPLEARLQSADLLVLGGLNEGTWPPAPPEDPWLSRGMRRALGLPTAERRVGLSAHDFVMGASSGAVLLTRSLKVEGTPTRPARWLQRLEALCGEDRRWRATAATPWIHWRGLLDRDELDLPRPVPPPRPRPPVAARPRRLSATEVETWIRDPYAIYARRVLGLAPLDPLDPEPSGADRGSLVHAALAEFHAARRADSSGDALATLLACGRRAFGPLLDRPAVRAIWWPRFERLARWLVAWETRRAADGHAALAAEVTGALALAGPAGAFELRARADRIDRLADAGIAILDWKTGALPGLREMAIGLAPQLGLEGAIAAAGGFAAVAAAMPSALVHIRLTGGEPPGLVREYRPPRDMPARDVAVLVAEARRGLERLIAEYDREDSAYLSRPRPKFVTHAGDYDVLARVSEWSAALGDEG